MQTEILIARQIKDGYINYFQFRIFRFNTLYVYQQFPDHVPRCYMGKGKAMGTMTVVHKFIIISQRRQLCVTVSYTMYFPHCVYVDRLLNCVTSFRPLIYLNIIIFLQYIYSLPIIKLFLIKIEIIHIFIAHWFYAMVASHRQLTLET